MIRKSALYALSKKRKYSICLKFVYLFFWVEIWFSIFILLDFCWKCHDRLSFRLFKFKIHCCLVYSFCRPLRSFKLFLSLAYVTGVVWFKSIIYRPGKEGLMITAWRIWEMWVSLWMGLHLTLIWYSLTMWAC